MKLSPAKVRRLRDEAALSQQALADLAGVGIHTVNRLEAGKMDGNVRPASARKLATALGVEPRELMEGAPPPLFAEPVLERYRRMVRRLAEYERTLGDRPNELEAVQVGLVATADTITALLEVWQKGDVRPEEQTEAGGIFSHLTNLYSRFNVRLQRLQGEDVSMDPEAEELRESARDLARGAA